MPTRAPAEPFEVRRDAQEPQAPKELKPCLHLIWRYLSRKLYLVELFDGGCTFMPFFVLRHFKFKIFNGFSNRVRVENGHLSFFFNFHNS